MNYGVVYKIKNIITGNYYIGSTNDFPERIRRHYIRLKRLKHHNIKMQEDYNKYGEFSFIIGVLEDSIPNDTTTIRIREQIYIDLLKPTYNINPSAHTSKGVVRTDDMRKKISNGVIKAYNEGRLVSPSYWKGKTFSKDHRNNISKNNARIKWTEIELDVISQRNSFKDICVYDLETLELIDKVTGLRMAAKKYNMKPSSLHNRLFTVYGVFDKYIFRYEGQTPMKPSKKAHYKNK